MRKAHMRKTKQKKGQAAMEFLTTYGWAFIIILTTISALVYFGVLKWPVSSRCIVSPEFACVDYQVQKQALNQELQTTKIILVNNMDNAVNIWRVTCTYPDNVENGPFKVETLLLGGAGGNNATMNWEQGEKRLVLCDDGTQGGGRTVSLINGEKTKIKFAITYSNADSEGFNHTIEGEIVTAVKS